MLISGFIFSASEITSMPLTGSICNSVTTTEKGTLRIIFIPSSPLTVVQTLYPALFKVVSRIVLSSSLSSMIKTFILSIMSIPPSLNEHVNPPSFLAKNEEGG